MDLRIIPGGAADPPPHVPPPHVREVSWAEFVEQVEQLRRPKGGRSGNVPDLGKASGDHRDREHRSEPARRDPAMTAERSIGKLGERSISKLMANYSRWMIDERGFTPETRKGYRQKLVIGFVRKPIIEAARWAGEGR